MTFNKIKFYYFSGTGNTLLVVNKMKETFEAKGVVVELHRIEKAGSIEIDPDCVLGLAFPVACQGTYPFVWDFIEALPETHGVSVFMVDTLGAFSGGVVGPARKILKDKGYNPLGAREISMPDNFFLSKNDPTRNETKKALGLKKAEKYAMDILTGKSSWKRIPVISDLVSRISLGKTTWKVLRKLFKLKIDTTKCIKCGLCAKLCPVQNIEMKEYPQFQDKCVICMRCISFCPKHAIFKGKDNHVFYSAVAAEDLIEEV
ncbi:MAG: EFR1 family ferrodoxin [Candidatus Omnitrophica bacterium]|nr:EFR1 family ferrodoxin [Candidatus Omnitrophota bacterium]MBU1894650.1 EFR1 family ferrodoxin [Candidatus Omnitrophota bacterium]